MVVWRTVPSLLTVMVRGPWPVEAVRCQGNLYSVREEEKAERKRKNERI